MHIKYNMQKKLMYNVIIVGAVTGAMKWLHGVRLTKIEMIKEIVHFV